MFLLIVIFMILIAIKGCEILEPKVLKVGVRICFKIYNYFLRGGFSTFYLYVFHIVLSQTRVIEDEVDFYFFVIAYVIILLFYVVWNYIYNYLRRKRGVSICAYTFTISFRGHPFSWIALYWLIYKSLLRKSFPPLLVSLIANSDYGFMKSFSWSAIITYPFMLFSMFYFLRLHRCANCISVVLAACFCVSCIIKTATS